MADGFTPPGKAAKSAAGMTTLLDFYAISTCSDGEDRETVASDMLTDLIHWCDSQSIEWPKMLARAEEHHDEEIVEAGDATMVGREWVVPTVAKADRPTFKLLRFYQGDHPTETLAVGLEMREAKRACRNPESSSTTCTDAEGQARTAKHGPWFVGYERDVVGGSGSI